MKHGKLFLASIIAAACAPLMHVPLTNGQTLTVGSEITEADLAAAVTRIEKAAEKRDRKAFAKYGCRPPGPCDIGDMVIKMKTATVTLAAAAYYKRLQYLIHDGISNGLPESYTWTPGILNPEGTPAPEPVRYEGDYPESVFRPGRVLTK